MDGDVFREAGGVNLLHSQVYVRRPIREKTFSDLQHEREID